MKLQHIETVAKPTISGMSKGRAPRRKAKRAAVLLPSDIRHVLRVTEECSRQPARDCLLILISICAGLRCSEIAQITPSDVMWPNGRLRSEVALRADITKGCHPRLAYFSSKRLTAALERYIAYRLVNKVGLSQRTTEYRGLAPDQPLIFSSQSCGFAMIRKPRRLESGGIENYFAADGLEKHFRKLYDRAGLKDCSSHAGRRTFANVLLKAGNDLEVISRLLGHSEIDNSAPYFDVTPAQIEAAFENALETA